MSFDPNKGKVVVIGGTDTVIMMKSIGCIGIEERDPEKVVQLAELYSKRPEVGIILIEKSIGEIVYDELDLIRKKTGKIISLLPTISSGFEPVDMKKLVMRALGFG